MPRTLDLAFFVSTTTTAITLPLLRMRARGNYHCEVPHAHVRVGCIR